MRIAQSAGRALRPRGAAPARAAPPQRLATVARAAAPAVADAAAVQALVQQIAEKESVLAGMFERRPMPKSSEVAALRNEINALKAALPAGAAPRVAPAAPSAAAAAKAGGGLPSGPRLTGAKQADRDLAARIMAEMDASLAKAAPNVLEDRQLAALEAANAALRSEAQALLKHQALLEGLLAEARAGAAVAASVVMARMKAKLAKG